MKEDLKNKSKFLLYKGKPLVRCEDIIYYGDMKEPFVVKFEIKSKSEGGNLSVADKVIVQLLDTNPNVSSKKKILKTSEKDNLYSAIDIANVWLERSLAI